MSYEAVNNVEDVEEEEVPESFLQAIMKAYGIDPSESVVILLTPISVDQLPRASKKALVIGTDASGRYDVYMSVIPSKYCLYISPELDTEMDENLPSQIVAYRLMIFRRDENGNLVPIDFSSKADKLINLLDTALAEDEKIVFEFLPPVENLDLDLHEDIVPVVFYYAGRLDNLLNRSLQDALSGKIDGTYVLLTATGNVVLKDSDGSISRVNMNTSDLLSLLYKLYRAGLLTRNNLRAVIYYLARADALMYLMTGRDKLLHALPVSTLSASYAYRIARQDTVKKIENIINRLVNNKGEFLDVFNKAYNAIESAKVRV